MKKIKHILIVFLLAICGCEDSQEFNYSPRENFEALWRIMDEHYCFFEYKKVDWDDVYDRYSIQVEDTMNQFRLFDLLGEMLAELKDGHTNLNSSFDVARYWKWYENYPVNFYPEIQKNYMGTDYLIAGGFKYLRMAQDQIGYIYYGSFSSPVSDSGLNYIFYHFRDCKAIIIDIRDNGGGSLQYSDLVASRFTEEKILTGYIIHKTGKAHDDFSSPYPIYLEPSKYTRWLRPVVVLTNRHAYSAANDFVNKMRMLKNVTIIGDKTGGGSGLPFNAELPIGWGVRFSASPILDAEKQHNEFGIDPDIHIDILKEDYLKGKDSILEYAIEFLKAKK